MKKQVLFVAAESLPFVKTGGLADVIGALPKQLINQEVEVRVILPLYFEVSKKYFNDMEFVVTYPIIYGGLNTIANIYKIKNDETIYYFIQHQGYFERDNIYGYPDDGERFGFFQRAVLDLLMHIDYKVDIIHCHDWHSAMIPFLANTQYPKEYQKIKYVFTIHNLSFQGIFPMDALWFCLGINEKQYNKQLEFMNNLNWMKTGIEYADKITTVSPTYANEILTAEFGEKLENVLKRRKEDILGIVNGLDMDLWNPKTDKNLVYNYTEKNFISGKSKNKVALQERLGLRVCDNIMVVAMVSRLTWQKGIYLLIDKMQKVMANDLQLIILGTGDSYGESQFKKMEYDYRRRAVYYSGYNDELAHLIYGGSDMFLMPSLFEPCGISQLIAMRYGSLPLVRETGGLKDTVSPYNQFTKEGTGFSFSSYNSDDFLHILNMAVDLYYQNPEDYNRLISSAMKVDSSWKKSTSLYLQLYNTLLGIKR